MCKIIHLKSHFFLFFLISRCDDWCRGKNEYSSILVLLNLDYSVSYQLKTLHVIRVKLLITNCIKS